MICDVDLGMDHSFVWRYAQGMRLFFLVCLTLVAFAANSILGRAAIGGGAMDATGFGLLRLASGAVMLVVLSQMRGFSVLSTFQGNPTKSLWGGASLTLYMVGFAIAYKDLDAGLGALILFAVVQVSMFLWGAISGQRPTAIQIGGAALALAGLAYVVWPRDDGTVDLLAAALMGLSGLGWGIYSLLGRGVETPLASTAVNFCLSTLMILPVLFAVGGGQVITLNGVLLAVVSGAVTSGLGYALWYSVLPRLSPQVAATVQLSVPVIAIVGGALLLAEPVGIALIIGSAVILGGIAIVALAPKPVRPADPAKVAAR